LYQNGKLKSRINGLLPKSPIQKYLKI